MKVMKNFEDITWGKHSTSKWGIHGKLNLDNGYTLSVIAGDCFYCSPKVGGVSPNDYVSFEVAIIDSDKSIVGDPKGWQSREDIDAFIYSQCEPTTEVNIYKQGQLDLIEKIKSQVQEMESNQPSGFDLALDIISLLKNIKPIIK